MLPPLDGDIELTAHTAKQDRIKVVLGRWVIIGDDNAAYQTLLTLADHRIADEVPGQNIDPDLRWFNAPQGHMYFNPHIKITKANRNRRSLLGVPLVAGRLQARLHGERRAHDFTRYALEAEVTLNPTRFARHHSSRLSDEQITSEPTHYDPRNLVARTLPSVLRNEAILDGTDNVLLSHRSRHDARPERWPQLVRFHFQHVWLFFTQKIEAAMIPQHLGYDFRHGELNLKEVETYWEYECEDALDVVTRLTPALQAQGRLFGSRLYPLGETVAEINLNAYMASIRLTDSIRLRFYAKTNKRVRIEVIHDLTQASSRVPVGGHTTEEPEAVYDWLHQIAEDAARRGREVLANMRQELARASEQRSIYSLVTAISRVARDEATCDRLVSLLINNTRIVLRNHDELRPLVQELMQRNILIRSRSGQQVFTLHPQYQAARGELRGVRRRQL